MNTEDKTVTLSPKEVDFIVAALIKYDNHLRHGEQLAQEAMHSVIDHHNRIAWLIRKLEDDPFHNEVR